MSKAKINFISIEFDVKKNEALVRKQPTLSKAKSQLPEIKPQTILGFEKSFINAQLLKFVQCLPLSERFSTLPFDCKLTD